MNFKEILSEAIDNNTKIIVTGYSGWGKSEMIQQVAEEKGYELIDFRLSEVLPEDLVGIPKLRDDYYEYVPPKWLYEVVNNPDKKYLLFLDEITQGTPEVLNICYKIFDKVTRVGNYTLDNVAVVGATNYQSESNYLSELPTPLQNRACMIELDHDLDRATDYIVNKLKLPQDTDLSQAIRLCIKESNPRSTEKAISLMMNNCSKHICLPYIGAQSYSNLSVYLRNAQDPTGLTGFEKARLDLEAGFTIYANQQFKVVDPYDLKILYNLTDEEYSVIRDEFNGKSFTTQIGKNGLMSVWASRHTELDSSDLEKLSESLTFNPYAYIQKMKLKPDVIERQKDALLELYNFDDLETLFREIMQTRMLPIETMREFKDDIPWDEMRKLKDKGLLTEAKLREFREELSC